MKKALAKLSLSAILMASSLTIDAQACTRVICESGDRFITARSMDWEENIPTSLWIFPKGMKRDGGIDKNSIKWTSNYGSVVAVGFDSVTGDGMNEKGLVVNLLWLSEANYGKSDKPTLSIGALAQYVLDLYANVDEAVKGLKDYNFQIIAPILPGDDREATMHLTISDASGDSAIVEFIDGKIKIHHSKKYKVATNSPVYDQQLAINSYWQTVGGKAMLPGTSRAADRYTRADFYTNNTTKIKKTEQMEVARAFSIIREASVPLGYEIKNEEALTSTIWRIIADQKALKYYIDPVISPATYWVDINKLDLKKGAEVKTLDLTNYPSYSGEVSNKFIKSKPFEWIK